MTEERSYMPYERGYMPYECGYMREESDYRAEKRNFCVDTDTTTLGLSCSTHFLSFPQGGVAEMQMQYACWSLQHKCEFLLLLEHLFNIEADRPDHTHTGKKELNRGRINF